MTPVFTPIQPLLFALTWVAEPATTYTIQTSPDLELWNTLPFVIEGEGQPEQHQLELLHTPTFARLQFSTDGDTNQNGLPDIWEWTHFGHFETDPDADPDSDGASTYTEWLQSTDPLDFFNGEMPVIQLSGGTDWYVQNGQFASQVLHIGVYHLDGTAWANAPVRIEFESGFAGILTEEDLQIFSSSILLYTDSLGRLDSLTSGFHILATAVPGESELIRIRSGSASARLFLRTIAPLAGSPPRRVTRIPQPDGMVEYSWSGLPEGVSAFRIEEKDSSGQWMETVLLNPDGFPELDPVSGLYSLVTNPLEN